MSENFRFLANFLLLEANCLNISFLCFYVTRGLICIDLAFRFSHFVKKFDRESQRNL